MAISLEELLFHLPKHDRLPFLHLPKEDRELSDPLSWNRTGCRARRTICPSPPERYPAQPWGGPGRLCVAVWR